MTMYDNVTKPKHYQGRNGLEAIDVHKNFLSEQELRGYYKGNCLKYLLREQAKNGVEDLKKARQYLDWLIAHDEEKNPAPLVVVPQFVAEWIEECKIKGYGIGECITNSVEYKMPDEVIAWFDIDKATEKDKELLVARAFLDGYKIEQEKLYTVEILDKANHSFIQTYLAKNNQGNVVIFQAKRGSGWAQEETAQLTEAEIRKDFEWAWQAGFAKEVE